MRRSISILFTFILFSSAKAQIRPDTLDNRRYYPLEVGNEWQYTSIPSQGAPIPSYQRITIVADTIINNKQYFQQHRESFDKSFLLENESFSWFTYNAVGAVRGVTDLENDASSSDSTSFWYHADFGDTLMTQLDFEIVGGAYDSTVSFPGQTQVSVAAIKTRNIPEPLSGNCCFQDQVYAADFGLVSQQVFDGPTTLVSYARLSGIEYGIKAVTVGQAKESDSGLTAAIFEIYPNPASDIVTIEYEMLYEQEAHISVYNIIGRSVFDGLLVYSNGERNSFSLDTSRFPSGTYAVVFYSERGQIWVKGLSVLN